MRSLRYLVIVSTLLTIVLFSYGHKTSKASSTSEPLFLKLNRVLNLEPVKCNQESTNKNVADVKKEFSLKDDQIMTIDYNKLIAKSDYEILSKFKLDDVDFYDNAYLLDFQQSDVNGDKIEDNILMTGVHEEDFSSPYHDNITLIIQDGKSKKLMFLTPKNAHGYGYSFSMGDFNGDKVKDILVSVNNDMTGGAGQYTHSIYSLKDNRLKVLFDNEKIMDEINLKVMFMDNFKIMISLPQIDKKIIVDKSDQKKKYKELNLYKGNKLRKKTEGSADNYSSLVPKDIDKDGILELKGMQYISGYGHSDGLGMAISVLKYNNKKQKWIVKSMEFEAFDD